MSKWISVKDRLPEILKLVLVCNPSCVPTTYGWYLGSKWAVNDEPNCSLEKIDVISFITHWMPLPQPPKEQAEND